MMQRDSLRSAGQSAPPARRQVHPPLAMRTVPPALASSVLGATAALYSMTPAELLRPCREPVRVEARRIVAQILYEHGYGGSAIGRVLARDHSTIRYSLRCLEQCMSADTWECLQMARASVRARLQATAPPPRPSTPVSVA